MATSGINAQKENFGKIKNLTTNIIQYLVSNNENFWKLLYYIDPSLIVLEQVNLTLAQKQNMIIKDAFEMYKTDKSVTKNILFQDEIDEAFKNSVPQVRITTGNMIYTNDYQGYCEVKFKIVIPNKQLTFIDTLNANADRYDYITYELIESLANQILPESVTNTPLFMNRSAPDGSGRNTGSIKGNFNTNYSGGILTMAVRI
jgi:hypothetical protein